jgi:ABC-type transport system involved in multi-copper enzyme maturation permease subunit
MGLLRGAARVFDLSLGQLLWSRRTIFMALVLAVPVIIAIVERLLIIGGISALRVNDVRVSGPTIFGLIIWLVLRVIVPILGVFYGTALIADEVDDKTITYLFTRPVRRGAVLLGKYLAYLVCTVMVVLPAVVIVYFLVVPFREIPGTFRSLAVDVGLLTLGLAAYGAVFALVGALLRKPVVVGLVFAFGWEQAAMLMPGYLSRVTIGYYLQALIPHTIPSQEGVSALLQALIGTVPDPATCLAALGLATVVALVLACRVVERREYVLEQ